MLGFPGQETVSPWSTRRIAPVMGSRGMVAAAHPLVASAGSQALARGGNAVDAAVSAALVASVVMPDMCGLGGDLFAIVHDPRRPRPATYLGSGIAPRGLTMERATAASPGGYLMPTQGELSIGVPGMVRGYRDLLREHGSMSFADLVQPALAHAENGHPIARGLADHLAPEVGLLSRFPASAAVFLTGGQPLTVGQRLVQSDLARTFRRLIDAGLDDFYNGELAERIARGIQEVGGLMTADDLAQHETEISEPLSVEYRGYRINQTGLPSQGMIHLEAMKIFDKASRSGDFYSEDWIHTQIEVMKLAFADRIGTAQDPRTARTPLARLLSDSWAETRAAEITDTASTTVTPGQFQDGDTTYLCTADSSGMMVSLIQSVSHAFGSGVVAGDTGVVMNNRVGRGFTLDPTHPNCFAPGKRTMHTLLCFSVEQLDGTPFMVGGTPGGDGQAQWDLQMLTAMIDAGLDVQQAVEMPRWTVWPGTDPIAVGNPYQLRLEREFGDQLFDGLGNRGHEITTVNGWHGAAQIISRDPETGICVGGSDPRVEGQAIGL